MSGCNFRRRSFLVTSLALAGGLLFATFGVAGKPGGGGGGSGNTGGGTIYFSAGSGASFGMSTMNSDGSGKTALPLNVKGTPSRMLHGGHRWFLTRREIVGETYPNGGRRGETFAVRDDGNEDFTVQLTDDPDLQFLSLIWAPGETADAALFSGLARRWVFDEVADDWVIDPDSVGIYIATVLFDEDGDVTGLAAAPHQLVSVGVFPGGAGTWWPDVDSMHFDWSPDLTEIVYSNADNSALLTQDLITGEVWTLTTGGTPYAAKWSPVGNLIVFANGYGGIETIAPDGTGRRQIIRPGSYYFSYPDFSPTGSHLVYAGFPAAWFEESDLFRATINGKSAANLTSGIPGRENIAGWR
jgi:hypothetical protein